MATSSSIRPIESITLLAVQGKRRKAITIPAKEFIKEFLRLKMTLKNETRKLTLADQARVMMN